MAHALARLGLAASLAHAADPCAAFDGVAHTAAAGQPIPCCAAACNAGGHTYCGGSACDSGPGGGDACCASHIVKNDRVCGTDVAKAPCLLASTPPPPTPAPAPTPAAAARSDTFVTYNASMWSFADKSLGTTDGCKVYYLKNHSRVNAALPLGEGAGLSMLMSGDACKNNPRACEGATMAADHLTSTAAALHGDYTLRMRAPYQIGSTSSPPACNPGVYAYFTAGYANKSGKWNEMNFGFHPDRDSNGTAVSCEHHDDTGGYHETTVALGFNYRASFNTFVIRCTEGKLAWLVAEGSGPLKEVHSAAATLTEPMTTRLIYRTNFRDGDPGLMPDHSFEISHFSFTPA